MNLLTIVIRIILGLIFGILGYFLADKYLPSFFGLPEDLVNSLSALVFGAAALFVLPLLAIKIGTLITHWISQLIQTTVAKALSDVFTQMPRVVSRDRRKEEKEKKIQKGGVLLDTSVIIDGRIKDVIKAGFVDGPIIVPRFVLEELQSIADSESTLKRERGRRGLTILKEIKDDKEIEVRIEDHPLLSKDVDSSLVQLAKKLGAKIATCDFNLNKVARLSEVKILNVNELTNAVKTVCLPGEVIKLKIIQDGKETSQGVGYLEDGTMIVVENGGKRIGDEVEIEVLRVLQTAAGRMVFGSIREEKRDRVT